MRALFRACEESVPYREASSRLAHVYEVWTSRYAQLLPGG